MGLLIWEDDWQEECSECGQANSDLLALVRYHKAYAKWYLVILPNDIDLIERGHSKVVIDAKSDFETARAALSDRAKRMLSEDSDEV